jgi:phosphatidylserine decarboxylase
MYIHILLTLLLTWLFTLPLAWKWQLGVVRIALIDLGIGLAASLLVTLLAQALPLNLIWSTVISLSISLIGIFAFLAYRFYRDPERTVPQRDDAVISPADGKIIYVREAKDGVLPVSTKHGHNYTLHELTKTPFYTDDVFVIGISMSFLDVHVNRAPIAGGVTLQQHFPGHFNSLRLTEAEFENERATTVFERDGFQVAAIQIASHLVRQIVSFVKEGQTLTMGQRYSKIRFGSQVDLVLPARADVKITVRPGDTVKAGESILATFSPTGTTSIPTQGVLENIER